MVDKNRPRKGSLGFSPRKRAAREVPRFRSFPGADEAVVQGFLGYKSGMTHVIMIDDKPNSPTEGAEVQRPVTVIETPPVEVRGVLGYEARHDGLAAVTEAGPGDQKALKELRDALPRLERVSVTLATRPDLVSGVPTKQGAVAEMPVSGEPSEALDHAEGLLGDELRFSDLFSGGEMVDVVAVTKGKGTQGPVKRWGIKVQDRKAQRKGKGRHIGNLGPWHPTRVRWQVPQAGQKGYENRTELNKRILKVGDDPEEVNPDGGFPRYGLLRNDYVLLKGSVPGPARRLIGMRRPMRPKELPKEPNIRMISTSSKQGA